MEKFMKKTEELLRDGLLMENCMDKVLLLKKMGKKLRLYGKMEF